MIVRPRASPRDLTPVPPCGTGDDELAAVGWREEWAPLPRQAPAENHTCLGRDVPDDLASGQDRVDQASILIEEHRPAPARSTRADWRHVVGSV